MNMRKYIKYKVLGLAFIVIGIVACDTASQEPEPIVPPVGYPVPTYVNATGTTVVEGTAIIYNITIDQMIDRALTFAFRQTGGTATDADYSAASAVIAPYTKSTQLIIQTNEDFDTDASETIVGEIGVFGIADRYLLDPASENQQVSLTITNFVSPNLEVAFYWNADVTFGGETYDAADYIDFDFLVSPEADFDIADPWASEIGIYDAATGSHPETMTLEGLDDGSYLLWADLYYNDFVGYSDGSVKIPIVAKFTRQGTTVVDTEVGMDPAEMMPDNTPGYDNDPSGVYNAVIAKVTVAGDKYTITKYDGTTIGPFKSGTAKTPRPLNYKTK
jgi:hypothetical protein